MIKLTREETFDILRLTTSELVAVFCKENCAPCSQLSKLMENDNRVIIHIYLEDFPDLFEKYGIVTVPTSILFKKGEENKRTKGVNLV